MPIRTLKEVLVRRNKYRDQKLGYVSSVLR